jgi:predicted RNA-binding protein (virulence factor B family)
MTDEEFFEDSKNRFKNAIGPLVLPAWFSQPTKVQPGPLPKGKKK